MRITSDNTIGLVIDIQERLVPAMLEFERLIKNCRILISGLNELSVPLVVTQQYTRGLGETVEDIKSVVSGFEYIEKRDFSCCGEPTFIEKLKDLAVKNIIICGIESHVCVLQTAVDLKEAGYNPIVVLDCVSSRTNENVKIALERFRFEGIMVSSYESILFELTKTSASPAFKAISNLVK